MDIFSYIAKNNPQGTVALLRAYNYKPTKDAEANAHMLRKLTHTYRNSEYFKKLREHISEIHPDKAFIIESSVVPTFPEVEKKVVVEEKHSCDGGGCKCGGKCGSKHNASGASDNQIMPIEDHARPIEDKKVTAPISMTDNSVIISKQTLINIVGLLAFGALVIHFANAKSN